VDVLQDVDPHVADVSAACATGQGLGLVDVRRPLRGGW
jgi:hypothetical protein